ncbi:MAG: LysR family transcriptional regulator [Nocardioidaceae bacterium]
MARIEHIDWLETFVAVVDNGGFSAAATAVHRSQSRVSAHVAALEQALNVTLFDRRHRPVALTDAGEAYLPHAREVLSALDRGLAEIESVIGVTRGMVVLGSYPSASAAFLPGLVRAFSRSYPQVRVDLTEQTTLDLAESLNSGELHLALRPLAPLQNTEGLACRPLWREPLVAVFPLGHALAEVPEPIEMSTLVEHPLITIGGHMGQEVMYETHSAFKRADHPPRIAWQTDQPQTLANFVRAGLGVGVTNALAMQISDTSDLQMAQVGSLDQGRTVGIFWDPYRYMPRAARVLLEEILNTPTPDGTRPPARDQRRTSIRTADNRQM